MTTIEQHDTRTLALALASHPVLSSGLDSSEEFIHSLRNHAYIGRLDSLPAGMRGVLYGQPSSISRKVLGRFLCSCMGREVDLTMYGKAPFGMFCALPTPDELRVAFESSIGCPLRVASHGVSITDRAVCSHNLLSFYGGKLHVTLTIPLPSTLSKAAKVSIRFMGNPQVRYVE